jgi:hypothetical protein
MNTTEDNSLYQYLITWQHFIDDYNYILILLESDEIDINDLE